MWKRVDMKNFSFKPKHGGDVKKRGAVELSTSDQHNRVQSNCHKCPFCRLLSTIDSWSDKAKFFAHYTLKLHTRADRSDARSGPGQEAAALENVDHGFRHQTGLFTKYGRLVTYEFADDPKQHVEAIKRPSGYTDKAVQTAGNEMPQAQTSNEGLTSRRSSVDGYYCEKLSVEDLLDPINQQGKELAESNAMIPAMRDGVSESEQPSQKDICLYDEDIRFALKGLAAVLDTMSDSNLMSLSVALVLITLIPNLTQLPSRHLKGIGNGKVTSPFGLRLRMVLFSGNVMKWFHIEFDVLPDASMPHDPESGRINILLGKKVCAATNPSREEAAAMETVGS